MTNYTISSNFDITNLRLSDGAYRCYMLLQSLAYGSKTEVYPSIKYIACSLGRSCRTINRYIKELVSLNLIVKRRRGSISNLYVLVQKKINNAVERLKQAKNDSNKKDIKSNKNNNYSTSVKKDKFNDFEQRNYDFEKLENLLLNGQGNLSKCQIQRK
ncbi:helix-turn-helix domain-containing protein [Clostridium botulinum]|uniref:helix-turn-helix domain-containing protein n=1 Tax=Clostridium botulinum TaxID=1491 RepID=UPI0013F042D9|nr:helix-turn-helix domain-containing protein [Clostridium botulinum]MBY6996487.1 helix-turn-helix domain-containing protein [Clostridium botulinum]MBY7011168.1 helix-turn-helix domain-containing protein [Clostridium botulinum]MCR1153600.1 helix-turn-helix domain-containing protein [Clostridium botulinum]MCS6165713.1 helix-turn-helix domain-containing protein [Clostridium botulinum]NEZ76222.1 helix-turn-helix domain-containing protein [Clostridium botulinum]